MNEAVIAMDQSAFTQLYEEHADYALRCAAAITQNKVLAADAVQETFIRVYRHFASYDQAKPFKPWLYRILVNECRRIIKGNNTTITIDEYRERSIHPSEKDHYSFQEYEQLHASIQRLSDIYRMPIILKSLNDFSEKEIGDIMELNVNTVKSRLLKGRTKLRCFLETIEERRIGDGEAHEESP